MFFISVEDFFEKVRDISPLTREEEITLGRQKNEGREDAKEALRQGYLRTVAGFMRRVPRELQTLNTVYEFISTLDKAIDVFDFLQDDRFAHYLCARLRQCVTKCIANR